MRKSNLFGDILKIQNIFVLLDISSVKGVMLENIQEVNLTKLQLSLVCAPEVNNSDHTR